MSNNDIYDLCTFWIGPHGVLIPRTMPCAPTLNKSIYRFIDDTEIEIRKNTDYLFVPNQSYYPQSPEEYREIFAKLGDDGHYYFDTNRDTHLTETLNYYNYLIYHYIDLDLYTFWVGPFGILVPSTVDVICDPDLVMYSHIDGEKSTIPNHSCDTVTQIESIRPPAVIERKCLSKLEYFKRFGIQGTGDHFYFNSEYRITNTSLEQSSSSHSQEVDII